MRKFIAAAAAVLFSTQTVAQPQPAPPKLLVVISVDQLSGDLFDEYRPQFAGGLDRLASGTVFRNASSGELRRVALGDRLKARWPGSREVVVSGSAEAIAEAKNADQRWSWTGKGFSTDVPGAMVPKVVPKVNAGIAAALAQPRPPLQPTPSARPRRGRAKLRASSAERPEIPPRSRPRPNSTATRLHLPRSLPTSCSLAGDQARTC